MCVVVIRVENSLQILSGRPSRVNTVPNSKQSKTKLCSTWLKFIDIVVPEKYQNHVVACCEIWWYRYQQGYVWNQCKYETILNAWQLHRGTYKNLMLAKELRDYGTCVWWCNSCTVNVLVKKCSLCHQYFFNKPLSVGGDNYRGGLSSTYIFFWLWVCVGVWRN